MVFGRVIFAYSETHNKHIKAPVCKNAELLNVEIEGICSNHLGVRMFRLRIDLFNGFHLRTGITQSS
jgi:hypothetical protein